MRKDYQTILLVSILVLLTAALRVISTEFNVFHIIPIASIGLFSGSVLRNKSWSFAIPLFAMLLADIGFELFTSTPGFYGISQLVNYAALIAITALGFTLRNRNVSNVFGYTLLGSLIFFVLSNLGTWLGGYYNVNGAYTMDGLLNCYTMALPFYKSEVATRFFTTSILSDLAFSAIAFSAYWWMNRKTSTVIAAH